jgi:hypothetical protein
MSALEEVEALYAQGPAIVMMSKEQAVQMIQLARLGEKIKMRCGSCPVLTQTERTS